MQSAEGLGALELLLLIDSGLNALRGTGILSATGILVLKLSDDIDKALKGLEPTHERKLHFCILQFTNSFPVCWATTRCLATTPQ